MCVCAFLTQEQEEREKTIFAITWMSVLVKRKQITYVTALIFNTWTGTIFKVSHVETLPCYILDNINYFSFLTCYCFFFFFFLTLLFLFILLLLPSLVVYLCEFIYLKTTMIVSAYRERKKRVHHPPFLFLY